MRARAAYISSLTTTSIMLASTVLMLVIFGALLHFKRWPAGDGGSPADPVGVGGAQAPFSTAPAAFTRAIPPAPLPRRPIVQVAAPRRPASAAGRPNAAVSAPASSQPTGQLVVTPAPAVQQGPSSPATSPSTAPAPGGPAPVPTPPKGPPGPLGQATGIVSQVVAPVAQQTPPVLNTVSSTAPQLEQTLGIDARMRVIGNG